MVLALIIEIGPVRLEVVNELINCLVLVELSSLLLLAG